MGELKTAVTRGGVLATLVLALLAGALTGCGVGKASN
jgi:hypothetical protein